MNEDTRRLVRQNEVMITLLGRVAFNEEKIREIVTRNKKKDPDKYVEGYNACDGEHTVTELAKVVGVTQGTLSPILKEWENLGIVFEVQKPKGKFYRRLFPI